MPNMSVSPSSAAKPDLDWSQIRETVRMLTLAVTQIERSMREGDGSVSALASLFTSIMDNTQAINDAAARLPDSEQKAAVTVNFWDISEKMHTAVVTFQFFDKLTQRLAHVSYGLSSMGSLINDPGRLFNPFEWKELQDTIRARYNIDEDRHLFDAILNGIPAEEAMKADPPVDAASSDDNVELF